MLFIGHDAEAHETFSLLKPRFLLNYNFSCNKI